MGGGWKNLQLLLHMGNLQQTQGIYANGALVITSLDLLCNSKSTFWLGFYVE